MNEDYGTKHIYELPLDNNIAEADSIVYDQSSSGNSFRAQIRGVIEFLLSQYVAKKDLTNLTDEALNAFMNRLSMPSSPDVGAGLLLRDHSNETQNGLSALSNKLITATAHRIADMFFENLTTAEFVKLCRLLSGEMARESTGNAEGTLANRDLTNLTAAGVKNLNRIDYLNMVQTSPQIVIPASALGKCVRIKLNRDVASISLPTAGLSTSSIQQVLIIIDRNGFNIASDAFTANGYTLRGTGASMPSFTATFTKDKAIEFFCEYDDFTNPADPTWNYGYSKIGH